jgi:hypothetical protein
VQLFPYRQETLVSPLSQQALLSRLAQVTREQAASPQAKGEALPQREGQQVLFNGAIGAADFRLSQVLRKGDTFLPLLLGRVEATPRGCLLFIRYRLFPSAVFFLLFWTVVLLSFSMFYFFVAQHYAYGALCLALALGNYVAAVFFFHRQLGRSRQLFQDVINFQERQLD